MSTKTPSFKKPVQVTKPPQMNSDDFRPAVGPDNDIFVFERSVQVTVEDPTTGQTKVTSQTKLFWSKISNHASGAAQIFDSGSKDYTVPAFQSRADWSQTGYIVFNAGLKSTNDVQQVWVIHQDFFLKKDYSSLQQIPCRDGYLYPRWNTDQSTFVCSNYASFTPPVDPSPTNSWFDSNGNDHISGSSSTITSLDGTVDAIPSENPPAAQDVYGGMAAVYPSEGLPYIAFAGQAVAKSAGDSYNQDENYIYINLPTSNSDITVPTSCVPVDALATVPAFAPLAQGRSPDWSPDGKYIVFESRRSESLYAIWCYVVSSSLTGLTAVQLTSPTLSHNISGNAYHPKFFPTGKRIIFSSQVTLSDKSKRQAIFYIDFSPPSSGTS